MQTLLCLHGWGGSGASFAPLVGCLAREFRVLTPSFPCPPANRVYTLDDYARDLAVYLREHNVTHCYVLAHSFGARLVAVLNAQQPHLFTKIVITGGAGLRPRFSLWRWLKIRWFKWRRRWCPRARGGSPEYRQLDAVGQATFRHVVNRDLTPEIRQIKAPLLLLWGRRDRATPLAMCRRWQRLCPHAKVKIYRHADHFAYLTHTAQFLTDLREFYRA